MVGGGQPTANEIGASNESATAAGLGGRVAILLLRRVWWCELNPHAKPAVLIVFVSHGHPHPPHLAALRHPRHQASAQEREVTEVMEAHSRLRSAARDSRNLRGRNRSSASLSKPNLAA